MTPGGRDDIEVEALRTDRYLESLLVQREGRSTPGGGTMPAAPPDAALAATIGRLDRDLVRVHPSFRFEERLARRLAEVAAAMHAPIAAGAEGGPVLVQLPFDPALDPALDPAAGPPDAQGTMGGLPRPLLIGAASAALSIAGAAALVAWRLGRPTLDPMTRAVRAVAESRGSGHPRALVLPDRGRLH